MSFHIGIRLYNGDFVVYNEKTKEKREFTTKKKPFLLSKDVKNEGIKEMYEEIKAKINGKIGFACIYLDYYSCGNEIRKNIVKIGKSFGFLNIQLITWDAAFYLNLISQINRRPKNGDIIWLSRGNNCYIFEIINSKAKINKCVSFEILYEAIKINDIFSYSLNPNILIFDEEKYLYFNKLKNLFPRCNFFEVSHSGDFANVCLIKARIMAKDPELMHFHVEMQTEALIDIKINEKIVLSVDQFQILPFKKILSLTEKGENVFKIFVHRVFQDEIKLFFLNRNSLFNQIIIQIDLNEIITIDYFESINEVDTFTENSTPFLKSYIIPKEMKVNNFEINAVGIDLGTSRCCAAVNRRNGIETVALDNTGERLLPSYVAFDEENEKCGKLVVDRLQNFAKSTVFDSKRIIGRNFEDVKIDTTWPFEIICVKDKPMILTHGYNNALRLHPEEVSAVLLRSIKQKAEEFEGNVLDYAVITVPAAFTMDQKIATHLATKLAGWKNVYLLPEPIAASIAYFIDREISDNSKVLLFDLGGGTLDVCVFKIANKMLEIISNVGDMNMGGRDFDQLLNEYFGNKLFEMFNIDVKSSDKLKYRLMEKCMDIKHTLSTVFEASLDVSDFNTNIEDELLKITRLEFEAMAIKLLDKIKNVIEESLNIPKLQKNDINKVLIVGGACRMPMIQKLLKDIFPQAEHCCQQNPDEVVAIGAAYYAYYLQEENLKNNKSYKFCPIT